MISLAMPQIQSQENHEDMLHFGPVSVRESSAAVLADIYKDDINIAIWARKVSSALDTAAKQIVAENPALRTTLVVSPADAPDALMRELGIDAPNVFTDNAVELVTMFCELLGSEQAGLRLTTLDRAMCPRFHVDRVLCRLVTTYSGTATQWLPHQLVDREKLGPRSHDETDLEAGLHKHSSDIQQLNSGDVALLKGSLWAGNEQAGLVHRSPPVPKGEKRLLLTLDVVS